MISQADFSAGMVRNVARALIPENGARDIRGCLLDDDGYAYLRGPTTRLTTSQAGGRMDGLWDVDTIAGRRTVAVAASVGVVVQNGVGWTTLLGAVTSLVGGGLAGLLGGMVLLPMVVGGVNKVVAWGGETTVGATLGGATVVTVTRGSTTVTLAAGSWAAYVRPGMFLSGSGGFTGVGLIKTVDSTTQLTLATPWEFATQAMTGYAFAPVVSAYPVAGSAPAMPAGPSAVAVVSNRVLVASGKTVFMSNTVDPATGLPRPWTFDANDRHEFPADVIAITGLRDRAFVFTKAGIYVISNLALEIVDAMGNQQQRVERVSGDVVLRAGAGIAPWRDALVLAAVDGIYLLQASGQLDLVSRSITPLWQSLLAAGGTVSQIAVFRDHVFVPIGGRLLVGRLDRAISTPAGRSSPWTQITDGEAGGVVSVALQDPTGTPRLIASPSGSSYLLDLSTLFTPTLSAAATARDANGAAYAFTIETRDFVMNDGLTPAYVDRLTLDYEASNGSIDVFASKGQRATPDQDPGYARVGTLAALGNYATQKPRAVAVRQSANRLALMLVSDGFCSSFKLRGLQAPTRERGLQR